MDRDCTEIRISGIVQGVGFRPFVYRLARNLGLCGSIANTPSGVIIRVRGREQDITLLMRKIEEEPPPLSRIFSLEAVPCHAELSEEGFSITESHRNGRVNTQISPDTATCHECVQDIMDRQNRRFDYAFTNCTNCGPRYTIIEALPYDRVHTSMKAFAMCERCLAEYHDPGDRRFHAQPNACPECGPRLSWHDKCGTYGHRPLDRAAEFLERGRIIALKGLGGFHIAADASSKQAVMTLRRRKKRPFKPFAIMVKDLETAARYCYVSSLSRRLLSSPEAPIILLPSRKDSAITRSVAPGLDEIGVMLPYTPLHHLLFARSSCPEALVMTSGNPVGEPLCTSNREAMERLGGFVDGFLLHNRDIFTGVDDSVVRIMGGRARFIRRSRGFVPAPVVVEKGLLTGLAVGAELKNTFCLSRGKEVFLSQHIGNLSGLSTMEFFKKNMAHLQELLEITPEFVAADLHPDYLSTRYAMETGLPLYQVQHHFAHALSVMAEHGIRHKVLALVLDGTGLGTDGTIWGGEILECSLAGFTRLGCIRPFPLPGGDKAARQPWRMALSVLHATGFGLGPVQDCFAGELKARDVKMVIEIMEKGINSPLTSSCGRLFDAVAALCGLCLENTCEAQAAMILESCCHEALKGRSILETGQFAAWLSEKDPWTRSPGGLLHVRLHRLIRAVKGCMKDGRSPGHISVLFHSFLVASFGGAILELSRETGKRDVVLGGGCFQNRILLEGFHDFFREKGLRVYVNEMVPANDGGICLGQVVAGSFMHGERASRHQVAQTVSQKRIGDSEKEG